MDFGQVGMGGPAAALVAWRRARLFHAASLSVVDVSWRRAVRLISAGWLPQDELFGWNATAGLKSERDRLDAHEPYRS
jgi:hypothetical protein